MQAQALELAKNGQTVIQFYQQYMNSYEDQNINLIDIKLHLFLIGQFIDQFDNQLIVQDQQYHQEIIISNIWEEIQYLYQIVQKNISQEIVNYVHVEIKLIEIILTVKKIKITSNPNNYQIQNQVQEYLNQIYQIIDQNSLNEKFPVLGAKLLIVELKIRSLENNVQLDMEFVEQVKKGGKVLEQTYLQNLKIKLNRYMAQYLFKYVFYQQMEGPKMKNKYRKPGISIQKKPKFYANMQTLTINYHYQLSLCFQLNDKKQEAKVLLLLDKINQEIRKGYSNMIVFMQASPLVERVYSEEKQKSMLISANSTYYKISNFQQNILQDLKKKNKNICVRFEELSLRQIIQTFNYGSKILVLFFKFQGNNLYFENSNSGEVDVIDIEQFHKLIKQKPNIEILIICCNQGQKLARLFFEYIKIPVIIYFDFKEDTYESEDSVKWQQMSYTYLRNDIYDRVIKGFVLNFINSALNCETVKDAYLHSNEYILQLVNEKTNIKSVVDFKMFIGSGPKIYPDIEDQQLQKVIFQQDQLNNGKFKDISQLKAPCNNLLGNKSIKNFYDLNPIFAREYDIFQIIQLLRKKQSININGPKGIGKTLLGRSVAYFAHYKGLFKDGVYFFDLKHQLKQNNYNLKELMQHEFRDELFSKEIHYYFRNKQMTLIFDDFNILLENKNEIQYFDHIFNSIIECKTPFITISREPNRYKTQNLHQLQSLKTTNNYLLLDYFYQTNKKLNFPIRFEKSTEIIEKIFANLESKKNRVTPQLLILQLNKSLMFEKSKQSLKQKHNSTQNYDMQKQKSNQQLKKQSTQKRCSQRRKKSQKLNILAMDSDDSQNEQYVYMVQNIKRLSEKQYIKYESNLMAEEIQQIQNQYIESEVKSQQNERSVQQFDCVFENKKSDDQEIDNEPISNSFELDYISSNNQQKYNNNKNENIFLMKNRSNEDKNDQRKY